MNSPSGRPDLSDTTTVLLADDDPIVRQVVRTRLQASQYRVVGEAEDGRMAIEQAAKLKPDLLLLDLLMPNLPGIETLQELVSSRSKGQTLVFTSQVGPQQIVQALQAGARGIISKARIADLERAISAVLRGSYWVDGRELPDVSSLLTELSASMGSSTPARDFGLTQREIEVITMITEGCSNKELAARLNITEDTVKRHLTNIFDKVGMSTRLELALFALRNKLVVVSG